MLEEKYVEGSFQTGMPKKGLKGRKVSVHDLSPLKDKILLGVVEVRAILQIKVVPRYIRPLLSNQ